MKVAQHEGEGAGHPGGHVVRRGSHCHMLPGHSLPVMSPPLPCRPPLLSSMDDLPKTRYIARKIGFSLIAGRKKRGHFILIANLSSWGRIIPTSKIEGGPL